MRISNIARRAGISVEAVRYYEMKGLIDRPAKPETGGYREYSAHQLRRILFVRSAQHLGFSLNEIAELLALESTASAKCTDIRERACAKLGEVRAKMDQLGRIEHALQSLIAACPAKGPATSCSILEAINSQDPLRDHDSKG